MGIVLCGGTIVTAVDYYRADLRLAGEQVVAIGNEIRQPEDKVLDVEAASCA